MLPRFSIIGFLIVLLALSASLAAPPNNLSVYHTADQIIAGRFPENYSINGTLNVTPSTTAGTNFFIDSSGRVGIWALPTADALRVGGNVTILGNFSVNNTAFVVNSLTGRVGIGVSSPSAPLHVNGSVFVSNGAVVQNITSNVTLSVAGNVTDGTLLNSAIGVYVSGRYAYVASSSANALAVVDISSPSSPAIAGSVQDATFLVQASSVYVSGRYAYVTSVSGDRLTVVDVSNPASPAIIGSVSSSKLDSAYSVYVSGKYAYVASSGNDSLTVIDVSAPAFPAIAGSVTDRRMDGARSVYVSGKYAYVAGPINNSITIVDVSNPSSPSITGNTGSDRRLDGAISVYISGGYGYAASQTNNSLSIINISDPSAPRIVGSITDPRINSPYSVQASGRYAYITSEQDDALIVVDVSIPASPFVIATTGKDTRLDFAETVFIAGRYAYVAVSSADSLTVVDLGGFDVTSASIGSLSAGTISVTDNADIGNSLYVRNGINVGPGGILSNGPVSINNTLHTTPSGFVGIGSPNITSLLQITSPSPVFTINNTALGGAFYRFAVGSLTPSDLAIQMNGTTRMYIAPDGKIGIGTSSPYAGLMINATKPALQVNDSSYLAVSGGNVAIGTAIENEKLSVNGTVTVINQTTGTSGRIYHNGTHLIIEG